jgi:hypothetical protein
MSPPPHVLSHGWPHPYQQQQQQQQLLYQRQQQIPYGTRSAGAKKAAKKKKSSKGSAKSSSGKKKKRAPKKKKGTMTFAELEAAIKNKHHGDRSMFNAIMGRFTDDDDVATD